MMTRFNKILKQISEPVDFCKEEESTMLSNLKGCNMDGYKLIDSRTSGEEPEDINEWVKSLVNLESISKTLNDTSVYDSIKYKIRYTYEEQRPSTNSRQFCKEMMGRKDTVYRYEDIIQSSELGINSKFGHNGRPYNLFKWQGGPNCHHYWKAHLFRLIDDVEVPKKSGYNPPLPGSQQASQANITRSDKGYYPK